MRKIYLLAFGISMLFGNSFAQDTIQLPFVEQFSSGLFETNHWEAEENWQIGSQQGNPAPCARFHYSPVLTNYSRSLTSYWIDGGVLDDDNIIVKFDLKTLIVNPTVDELLFFDVFDGSDWIQKQSYTFIQNTDWRKKTIYITNEAKGKPFKIRFRAEGLNTATIYSWSIDNIEIWSECAKPYNFTTDWAPPHDPCMVLLQWTSPDTPPPASDIWLHWDNGSNFTAIGLTGGGTFHAAVRFTPQQLSQYEGSSLTKIRFYPKNSGGTIVVKVWIGPNASTLVRSKAVTAYISEQWNELLLTEPLPIDGSQELWIGYQISHGASYIAGADSGPALATYGDMISLDGVVWESMSQSYSLNYNWNLAGYVTAGGNMIEPRHSRSLTGYNIYRNDAFLAQTSETQYIDNIENYPEEPCYNVTAVYNDCESEFSLTDCWMYYNACVVGVNDMDVITLDVYPNPASDKVTIDYGGNITNVTLIDMMGRELAEYPIAPGSTSMTLDLTKVPEGIYLLRIEASDGRLYVQKLMKKI